MATVKLRHPSGTVKTFEFGHAARIIKKQVDKGYPKKSCWVMVKENPKNKSTDDSNNPANSKTSKKEQGSGTSGS